MSSKMDDDKVVLRKRLERDVELSRWAETLRASLPLADAIELIDERRRGADSDDQYMLTLELNQFLIAAGREPEADLIIDEMIASMPDDVRFPISKATLHLYFMNDPQEALDAINVALTRAQRTRFFRREALGVKARILLKLGLGDVLNRALEEIMSLEMEPGIPDIGRERDFVDRAPPGMIAEDVLARYNIFRPKRDGE